MQKLYGTAEATGFESWTYNPRFERIIDQLDDFYRANQKGYAKRYPKDTTDLRMTGWEPTVWWKNPYLGDAVVDIEDQINAGGDAVIEIRRQDSLNGQPVTVGFSRDEFDWALTEERLN